MLNGNAPASTQKLTQIVEGLLAHNSVIKPVPLHESLTDIGLTSIDMVNLMLAVEAEFNVAIPQADIAPENFRSIATIDALIARLPSFAAA